ncbi:BOS complex subunit NOMO1 [Episyrphus balteatus]|uniref:BOS complex subunit NOMO1 n=1 Tax=Episyrphus balteatus TaxID=286459 RepID=UPI0024865016|nr:BOS complex subunit NOMO1 [Episyrphus balteatus]XP_055839332.1 BOS complex subunit NOMO1 [Episyrphus balteatus]
MGKMKIFPQLFLILLIKLLSVINSTNANEVLGCGGFIKSHADIDFSKVEIKLLTKQGSLKDKTDCSPSNGYYFIPVYDKGEYILKISPPPGWSFEPEQVVLNFNGKTDICSQGKDVNFAFKGFGITGKVALAGFPTGARNVAVELKSKDGSDTRQTTTDINGIFSFTPIIPGEYIVKASHPKWHFAKSEHNVVVVSGNTELPPNSLVVSGFDVIGKVDSNGQTFTGIGVALFKDKDNSLSSKCQNGAQPIALGKTSSQYLTSSICYTQVEKNGEYLFKGVAPGKYLVKTVVENKNLKLHINPDQLEIEVVKDTLVMKNGFQITGFSVSGKVRASPGGKAIPKATIKLNGQVVATTSNDGSYTLENVKAGTFNIQVEAENLQFDEKVMKIQLSEPILPEIVASAFKVCGKVISKKSYVVGITKHGSTFHTTASSKAETGEWCTYLPSGKFSIEVLTTDADKAGGIQFFPVNQNLEVNASPMSGITFSQLRATLVGEIKCLPDAPESCTGAEVTLLSLDSVGQPTGQKQTVKAKNGKYSFKEILPGPYELNIPQSSLCFESTMGLININSASETAPPFIHKGYEVSIISSHRTIMHYGLTAKEDAKTPLNVMKIMSGVNTFCVPKAGEYSIKLESCHLYESTLPKTFNTYDKNPVMFTAVAHKIGVRVLSSEQNIDSLQLLIESKSGKEQVTLTSEGHKVDNYHSFRYDTYLKPEEAITIKPQSNIMLFKPVAKELVGGNDCIDIAFNFIATKGLIINGKIKPAIGNAKVTLAFPNNPELESQSAQSSATGEFKFGPIDESLDYEISAEKESYVFSEYNKATHSFSAHKLCEIVVSVKDDLGNKLSGVLLSLSGAESYRKNLVTGDNGAINFHSLSPSEYFLRPMMKEYQFIPNSKMIDVKDGETINVELVGKRVAYSVFGTITSLNGEAFPQVNVEAVSDDKCLHHQEEAATENNGQYRIRGLKPGCTYTIRTKEGASNPNVERSIPESRQVELGSADIRNVNLIAISPITFVDVTARVTASLNEHYKSLRIQMYRKGSADSPIYSQRVESPLNVKGRFNPGIMVFFPRIPLDGKTYFVELKTTISDKLYSYTLPVAQFVANTSSVFVELDFKTEPRSVEGDLNQNSISALVLVALVAIAFFKQDLAMDFLNFVWSRLNAVAQDIAQRQNNNKKKDVRQNEPINYKEIEQMAERINAIKAKKKTKKI